MAAYIDFTALKLAVSFEAAIQALGLQMKRTKPNELRSKCPACKVG